VKPILLAAGLAIGAAGPAEAASNGAAIFDNNCALCHQEGGVGVPGQFPRLAGRVGTIAAKPQGRHYLPEVVLNGMSGRIKVDGEDILGLMPSFSGLSDSDIAAVLTFVSGLGNTKAAPFTAKDIAAVRVHALSPGAVAAERARLVRAKIVP